MSDQHDPERARPTGNGGSAVEELLERRLRGIPGELSDVVGVRIRAVLEAVQDRTAGSLEGVRSAVAGVEERLTSNLASLHQAIAEMPASVRRAVEDGMGEVRDDLEMVRALPHQVGRALRVIREAVGEIADTQAALAERLEDLGRETAAIRAEVAERMEPVDRLSGAIESMSRKRGFKDLVASERQAMEQQEKFVERLASLGARLAAHSEALGRRVAEVADGVALPEEAVARVTEQVTERVAPPLVEVLTREMRALDMATRGVRLELERVRKRMDSWGRVRAAPRLAEEIAVLEERVIDLERGEEEVSVATVTDRLDRLDRRLAALAETVHRQGVEPERRTLFRGRR
jgi:DNA repair exonuclease SbcCD ATPase subunit